MFVADNIDRQEETLSGFDTTHRVKSIIIQLGKFTDVISPCRVRKKTFRKSLIYRSQFLMNITLENAFPDLEDRYSLLSDQNKLYLYWIMCRKFSVHHGVPSWTGFSICIHDNHLIVQSSVSYMDCIDAPATGISTIYKVLTRALKIKESLILSGIFCVFDQSIFAKAAEIKWKHPDKYKVVY